MNNQFEKIEAKEIEGMFVWDICKCIFEKYKHLKSNFKLSYKEDEIELSIKFRTSND